MGNILDKTAVLDRIKEFYSLKGNAELARFLGVAPNTITNWYKRVTFDIDAIFTKCEDVNYNWLLTGKGPMLKEEKEDVQILHHPKVPEKIVEQQSINLYDINAAANLKTLFMYDEQEILGQISIPDIPKCDGAVYVRGDSMYPLLKSGDIIAFRILNNIQNVIYGEMYLVAFEIDGDDFLAVKYINHADKDGYIKLVSYNPHHDPKEIPISSITALALVKFSIRKNTMV